MTGQTDSPFARAALMSSTSARMPSSTTAIAVVEEGIRAEVEDIKAARANGESVWPVIDYADIEAGTVSPEQLALLHRRGCLVVRGHFEREQALGWDRDVVEYVDS